MIAMTAEIAKMETESPLAEVAVKDETPRQVLQGYRSDVTFSEVASATAGSVTVVTELDGHEFHGVGPNFETAAERAALEVITYLYSTEEIAFGVEKFNKLMTWKSDGAVSIASCKDIKPVSPLMVFNQLYQKTNHSWSVDQITVLPSKYEAKLTVEDQLFIGSDSTKKTAKQKAAESALAALQGVTPGSLSTLLPPPSAKKRRLEDLAARGPNSRTAQVDGEFHTPTPPKRKRKQADGGTPVFSESKNPLQILNEFRRGLVFNTVSQEGPSHAPVITMECEVDDKTFRAESSSKQKAKLQLGTEIVQYFKDQGKLQLSAGPNPDLSDNSFTTPKPLPASLNNSSISKTPLMMLYEMSKSQLPCEVVEYEENKTKRFVAKYKLNDKTFEGEGLSKQRAKHRAAEIILRDVYGVQISSPGTNGDGRANGDGGGMIDVRMLQFADRVRRAIMEKWRSICELLTEESAKRKVIAGVVATVDSAVEPMEMSASDAADEPDLFAQEDLMCITTGTKCLGGEFLSEAGTVLNDCHAEVLSARCLRYILYRHVERLLQGGESILLTRRESDHRFILRPGVRFHLYISTAPCGDARIFCPHELGDLTGDSHPGRRSRGLLRTKIESGEGTIPVEVNGSGLQTFDGVIQGERLLTMSCSDKLCLWNVVGMQGALLSRLLAEPVYFNTIIVGSVFVESHLDRALYQRAAQVTNLTEPFRAHRPTFLVTTERDERQPRKSPGISVVWISEDGDQDMEVITAARGKQEGDKPSRLCKQSLYSRFCAVTQNLPWLERVGDDAIVPQLYAEAKGQATAYKDSKRLLQQHFKSSGLGAWIRRPIEQDLFELVQ